jgi:hypothetical protein
MKKRILTWIGWMIPLLVVAYFIILMLGMKVSTGPFPLDWSISTPEDDTSFGGLFFSPDIDDSLPHYKYRKIEDSLKKIKEATELDNKGVGYSGRSFGLIGVYEVKESWAATMNFEWQKDPLLLSMMDSMDMIRKKFMNQPNVDSIKLYKQQLGSINWRYNVKANELLAKRSKEEKKLYYFGVDGYYLDYDTKFFMDKGTYNLAYVKWDSVIKREFDSTKTGHYERKQIRVRYSSGDNRVLVPISAGQYRFINGILNILFFVNIFLWVFLFIGLSLQILINISRGNAFNKKNILYLKIIAYAMLAWAVLRIAGPYFLRLLFGKMIPSEFELLPVGQTLIKNLNLLFIGIALFLVAKAFQRGFKLQQEQDLTV